MKIIRARVADHLHKVLKTDADVNLLVQGIVQETYHGHNFPQTVWITVLVWR